MQAILVVSQAWQYACAACYHPAPGVNHSSLVAPSLQPLSSQTPVVVALKACSATILLPQS